MRKQILIGILALLPVLVTALPAKAEGLRTTTLSLTPAMVVGYSKEYDQRRRELERDRDRRKQEAYEKGKSVDKTTGFLLGCLLGGVGIIIAYVMD